MSTNGKLNNSQRQALVKVLENAYDRRLQKLREAKESALAQVTREVKSELGIARIDEELEELIKMATKYSPVFDTFTNPVQVSAQLDND